MYVLFKSSRRWTEWLRFSLSAAWCLSSLSLFAETWHLPLPNRTDYLPLTGLAGWSQPGVYRSMEASRVSLRNSLHNDSLAEYEIADGAGLAADGRSLHLTMTMSGQPDRAVWVGVGSDTLDVNGRLDGLECLLMIGLDRGRWGVRQRALGQTVWAPAQLPQNGGACRLEVTIDTRLACIRSVIVEDAAGRRAPAPFADFDPDWQGLPPGEATAWRRVRIETRGAQAELLSLTIRHGQQNILTIR